MKAGKLSESVMKRSIFKQLHTKRDEVMWAGGIGIDNAAVSVEADEMVILSTEPVTADLQDSSFLAVCAALNNVACSGAIPVGILVTLLIPTTYNEQQLRDITKDIDSVCQRANVQVLGGHTEVTRVVHGPVISVTGVGKVKKEHAVTCKNIKPGMDILVTKWIGLEGTAILAKEKAAELSTRFSIPFIDKAKSYWQYIPIWSEAAVAIKSGAGAMHDISEGGIFGALWEMAQTAGVGLEIELKKIPIRQETVEICEFFDINPYKLISGGSMLLAAEDGKPLQEALMEAGIPAVIIGKTTAGNDRVLLSGEERRFLETTQTDEIHKVIERK